MLEQVGCSSMAELIDRVVPGAIRSAAPLDLPAAVNERQVLAELREIAATNQVITSFIGQGYHDCFLPPVLQRGILENPGWYTQYTPYQPEISQGRLEALLNFQTLVSDLTGMEIANASLLDESTAAAEAMAMCLRVHTGKSNTVFVSDRCHPQTIEVVRTRAQPLGVKVVTGDWQSFSPGAETFAVLVQYPDTDGVVQDYEALAAQVHEAGAMLIVATDLLALTLFRPPGEIGADVVIGSAQRFGVPLGFGGPHAAFFATREKHKRAMPGRVVGVSKDALGNPALRLAMQTREQHIRRDKATSNICTAQALLAIIAAMYAVYHGPKGLKAIAQRVRSLAMQLAAALRAAGHDVMEGVIFDTVKVRPVGVDAAQVLDRAVRAGMNLRSYADGALGISVDETTDDLTALLEVFAASDTPSQTALDIPAALARRSAYLTHPVFYLHRTETEMMRYLKRLETRDLSLTTSMIPLGSCTMKLNAAVEMFPVTWPEFARMHPYAPAEQTRGYQRMIQQLEHWLSHITGMAATSLQPNAGSQGEYAGLLCIRAYHQAQGHHQRDVCIIPVSAHGTNPASAIMAGMRVVTVACSTDGDIDLDDLRKKVETHSEQLAAVMVTYPSTHGVFEEGFRTICELVHAHGGQVYMDGANMNAQVGLCRPGEFGVDVCHLNLHKTFCIPHGGGGPGVGPICVREHLAQYLPGHPLDVNATTGPVAAAPYGSAGILVIPWVYIRLMGGAGLTEATQTAILSANYIARRLDRYFPVLFKGANEFVAHECVIDIRPCKERAGVEVEDVAKRLMDYGFHAPTMSWPVAGTLMIEPTESECKAELDRFCDAMLSIHAEIEEIAAGQMDNKDNPLKNAPHTMQSVIGNEWAHSYPREHAAFPAAWTRVHKFWPHVARVDNVYGDRNLICSCLSPEDYAQ